MDTPSKAAARSQDAPAPPGEDELYERYLDAVLAGRAETPTQFLGPHGDVSEALRSRVEAFHAEFVRRSGGGGDADQRDADEHLPFERLGEFRLLRRLHQGGMGTVFLAEQERLDRVVALKVIRPELRASETAAARFEREVLTLAKLRHPNVVTVFGAGREDGVRFLAMEFVPGRDLDVLLDEAREAGTPLAAARAVRWGAALARALEAAHSLGVVHRDVKPSNVRINAEGEPMLIDFGIAHEYGAEGLTISGPFMGTPLYAAPEQVKGTAEAVDARADVYGLAATLYECVTGRTPVTGGTVEQVLHRTLHEDPVPPRKLVPSISRDLEVVLLTALQKDPQRRYPSSAAFADDLEALLEVRPIRARPPGPVRRTAAWARRHPVQATALVVSALAAAISTGLFVAGRRSETRRRHQEARQALADARAGHAELREQRRRTLLLESEISDIGRWIESHYLGPETEDKLKRSAGEVARLRLEREAMLHDVLGLLRRAERLDPDLEGPDAVRAQLFLDRWDEATLQADEPSARYFRDAALAHDTDGDVRRSLGEEGSLTLTTEPPGATVYVFRYREQTDVAPDGDRRLVPVPIGSAEAAVPPGAWCLRVVRAVGALRREDVIVAVDGESVTRENVLAMRDRVHAGDVTVRAHRDGALSDRKIGAGVAVRATAAPLLPGPACRAGVSPLAAFALPRGTYVALVRRAGFEDRRIPFAIGRPAGTFTPSLAVALSPQGTTPAGFVHVEGTGTSGQDVDVPTAHGTVRRESVRIMEREVTCAEYLVFLNDRETRAEIEAADALIRAPRSAESAPKGGLWTGTADGRYELPADWRADWPVLGISYHDAEAYAAWRTHRARAEGKDLEFALPTYKQWVVAGEGVADRDYPFGRYFWPGWMNSCFSRPRPAVEPVLSYPVDESPCGVFDLCGGAAEWCEGWWGEGERARRLAGGSWAQARSDLFRVSGGSGAPPHVAGMETGFRLVVYVDGERR